MYSVSLLHIDKPMSYDEVVNHAHHLGWTIHNGPIQLEALFQLWERGIVALPDGQDYIIGLDQKESLEKVVYQNGTGISDSVLYYVPYIHSFSAQNKSIAKTCFSESDAVNNFNGCYIVVTKCILP